MSAVAQLRHRSVTADVVVRATDDPTRVRLEGLAVPWDTTITVRDYWDGDYSESVARGAHTQDTPDTEPLLYWRHREPLGTVDTLEDRDDGLYITATVAATELGRALAGPLLEDGAVTGLSIGFEPVEDVVTRSADGSPHIERRRIRLREVSVVPFPAFDDARLTSVQRRERTAPMPTDTLPAPAPPAPTVTDPDLAARVDALARQVATLPAPAAPRGRAGSEFPTIGHYVKALARGDDTARALFDRRYELAPLRLRATDTGDIPGALPAQWLSDIVRKVDRGRPAATAFGVVPLSSDGTSESWPEVSSTGVVAVHTEGTAVSAIDVGIALVTKAIKTFAGGTQGVTKLVIDRSSPEFLEEMWTEFARLYGRATESDFVATVKAAAAAAYPTPPTVATDDADGWHDAIVEASTLCDDDEAPSILLVSVDMAQKVLSLRTADGMPLVTAVGPTANALGIADLPNVRGEIAGLAIVMSREAAAQTAIVASRAAAQFREDGAAPLRVTSDDANTLTTDASIYGYGLPRVRRASGLVPLAAPVGP